MEAAKKATDHSPTRQQCTTIDTYEMHKVPSVQ